MLYIPSTPPFDLYHPDRRCRVKLYIKRVFITDEHADLIPQWLRFLRGVVDSEDLPLNISRETLQHNALLAKIRASITKRVLSDLKKRAQKEPESYATFWRNFGPVMKEGLCESLADKNALLEVCRFHSTKSGDKLISLDEYIERMQKEQKTIYYLTGENHEALMRSPQLEGFRKRDIEVLLLTDHVDDFWVTTVPDYKDKELESVTRAALPDAETSEKEEKKTEAEEGKQEKTNNAQIDNLITLLKAIVGDEVKDVRITNKLTDSPVCLGVGEQDMDIRIERFLVENKQLPEKTMRILEINPNHPLITTLAQKAEKQGSSEEMNDAAYLLLDQARIIEGEAVSDPGAFSRRMTQALQKGIAA